jgi:hypothetical protein
MKNSLRLEEALQFILAAYLAHHLPYAAWLYWALFLTPDLGMLGYIFNTRIGALTYNLFHHKAIAIILYLIGLYFSINSLQFVGLLLFGHSAFDRMLGYGLKFNDDFKHTHLGWIGKNSIKG